MAMCSSWLLAPRCYRVRRESSPFARGMPQRAARCRMRLVAKNPRKAPPNLPVLTSFNVVLSCSDWQWPMATRGKLGTCELCGWHRLDGPTAFTLRDIRLKRRGVLMFAMYDDGNDSAVSSHCASCKVDKLYYNIYE